MGRWVAVGFSLALAVGCTSSEEGEPITPDTVAATSTTVAVTTTTSTVPLTKTKTKSKPTPSTSTTSAPTTGTPTTSAAPTDPDDEGVQVAQQLATAFADGDWDTARAISPRPVWDDATYEEGFAGLDAATLVLGGTRRLDDRIVLYLFQVAHESRAEGPQTSAYCVRWDYLMDPGQIERVAGDLHYREAGTTPVNDLRRAAWVCDGFDEPDHWSNDEEPVPTPDMEPSPPPAPPPDLMEPPPPPVSSSISPFWRVVNVGGQEYICAPTGFGFGDFDCRRYYGGNPPLLIGWPDLRCSETLWGFKCTTDGYYPSELDGYEVTTVAANRVLCRWNQCWIWESWENPSSATLGFYDYECSGLSCTET